MGPGSVRIGNGASEATPVANPYRDFGKLVYPRVRQTETWEKSRVNGRFTRETTFLVRPSLPSHCSRKTASPFPAAHPISNPFFGSQERPSFNRTPSNHSDPPPRIPGTYQSACEFTPEVLMKLQRATYLIASTLGLDALLERVVNDIATTIGNVEVDVWLRDSDSNTTWFCTVCWLRQETTRKALVCKSESRAWLVM